MTVNRRRFVLALAGACMALSASAGELDGAVLHGETDRPPLAYQVGEPIVLTLSVQGAEAFPVGKYSLAWHRRGDDGGSVSGLEPLVFGRSFSLTTSLDRAGFVRLTARVLDADRREVLRSYRGETSTPEGRAAMNVFEAGDRRVFFDGGAGVAAERLRSVPEPDDFDAFWARRKARLAKVPLKAVRTPVGQSGKGCENLSAVSIACAGPHPSTGYLAIPTKAGRYPIKVLFHGYGHTYPNKGHVIGPVSGKGKEIVYCFSPHGYELGREPEYYDEFWRSICSGGKTFGFDTKQNEDPETCYFSGFTYRLMRALEYLKTLPEWDGRNLVVEGGSMGGLQCIWAAALESAVSEARPYVPWLCDMGGRDTLKRIHDGWYVAETPALRYYDPVNLAKRIPKSCLVDITRAGLGDYCCPPSGVAVLWNNLKCPKRIRWAQGSTHGYVPKEKHQETVLECDLK